MKYWFSFWVFLYAFQTFSQSDYERAVRLFEEADSIRYTEDNQLEKDKDNYRLAIGKFEEARELFNAVDSTYFGFRCGVGVLKCGEFLNFLDLDEIQNLRDRMILSDVQDSLIGQLYYLEGVAYVKRLMFDEAIESFNSSTLFLRKSNYLRPQINCYWYLGFTYYKIQEIDRQVESYQSAIELLLRITDHSKFRQRSLYHIRRNLMKTYLARSEIDSFLEVYEYCKRLIKQNPDWFTDSDKASLQYALAKGLLNVGNYKRASLEFERAMRLYPSSENFLGLSFALNSTGRMRETLNKGKFFLWNEEDDLIKSKLLNNLGYSYFLLGKLDSAKNFIRQALDINLRLKNERSLGINLENLGEIYMENGQYLVADELLHEALTYRSENQIGINRVLSKNFYLIGEFENAVKHSRLSVFDLSGNLVIQTRGNQYKQEMEACQWMLNLFELLFDKEKQTNYLHESLNLVTKLERDFRRKLILYSGQNMGLSHSISFVYEQGIRHSLLLTNLTDSAKYLNKAFQFSEWSKVHSLQRAKKTSHAKFLAGLPEAVIDKERSLKIDENFFMSQLSQQENLESRDSSRIARYRSRLADITESQDSLENIIRINYPRYHQLRYQDITLSVEEVQERLQPSQAFVEYYEGDTTSFVFTITKDDYQVKRIHLDDDTLITRYREHFEPDNFNLAQHEVNELSYQIYQNYLQPAIGALNPEITELIVVPDGKLSYVPFDILLTKNVQSQGAETMPYLLRDYQVHYTYSASLYFNDFSTLSTKDEYLAFAPEYETTMSDTSAINRLGSFRNQVIPLKYNQEEVAYISSQFKGLGYFGPHANEKNFKEKVDEYGVLHLAMHTIVDDDDPMNSKLVFANSKDSLEDDMLHAFEIYNMEIPSKLAVLSACETGFGQLAKGEGALSLARAFSYAGSPSVVMSHWPVDDQTTAVLMKSFYNYLSKGLPKSDAIRRSKLDFLDQTHSARMHPFFWGSFVVMGDDSPIYIKRLPLVNPFWVLLGCFLILGGAGFVVHRYEL